AWNAHAGPGLRVTADTRAPLANLEASEAADLDLVAVGQGIGDGREDCVDDGFTVLLRQVGRFGQLVDQIGSRHDRKSHDTIISAPSLIGGEGALPPPPLTAVTHLSTRQATLADSFRERTLRLRALPLLGAGLRPPFRTSPQNQIAPGKPVLEQRPSCDARSSTTGPRPGSFVGPRPPSSLLSSTSLPLPSPLPGSPAPAPAPLP